MNTIPFIPRGVKTVRYMRGLGSTPARINRRTGDLQINMDKFPQLPEHHKKFVLWHEEGHKVLDTSNEKAVDAYASEKYIDAGLPLSESVKALTQVLNPRIPQHVERAALQLRRAAEFDYFVNKNPNALHILKSITGDSPELKPQLMNNGLSLSQNFFAFGNTDNYDSLFGIAIGKKAKQRKQEKHELKMQKKQAKINIKNARADAIRTKAEAKLELASQGVAEPSTAAAIAQGLGTLGAGVASIATGGVLGGPAPIADPPAQAPVVQDMAAGTGLSTMQQTFQPDPVSLPPTFADESIGAMPKNRNGRGQKDPGKQRKSQINMTAIIVAVVVIGVLAFAFMKR